MFGSFGWMELLLILIIVLIIFGAGKIPQLGEGLGKAIKGFKKSVNEPDAVDVTPMAEGQGQQGQAPPSQVGQSTAQGGQPQPNGQAQAAHQAQQQEAPKQG